eukprot:GFYU01007365.1.p1 GENE.GFYU01007365.1~~GFYU01007365.1.p1  ORF type:complete len:325 (-),score=87.99 GFYU01007365.1:130-1104(-)
MNTFGLPERTTERRLAELLLRASVPWKKIEENTDETREYYATKVEDFAVREAAYNGAAETVLKWKVRPQLFRVWENKAPVFYKSAEYECTLYSQETKDYYDKMIQKSRMECIYESVVRLKQVEEKRPIYESDIDIEVEKIQKKALVLRDKKNKTVQEMEEALAKIGDGREIVDEFEGRLIRGQKSGFLDLSAMQLLWLPVEVVTTYLDLRILDIQGNEIKEVPVEVTGLEKLQKLYAGDNKIETIPLEIHRMREHILVVSLKGNPLDTQLKVKWNEGLPALLDYLREEFVHQRRAALQIATRGGFLKQSALSNKYLSTHQSVAG